MVMSSVVGVGVVLDDIGVQGQEYPVMVDHKVGCFARQSSQLKKLTPVIPSDLAAFKNPVKSAAVGVQPLSEKAGPVGMIGRKGVMALNSV